MKTCYDCKNLIPSKPYVKKHGSKEYGTVQTYTCKAKRKEISKQFFANFPHFCGGFKEIKDCENV